MNFIRRIQEICFQCFHSSTYFWAKILNGLIAFLILLSITVIPLHFVPGIEWVKEYLFLFDKIVVTIFTVEYFLRIWSAPKPMKYIFSWWGLIDLLAIVPFYLAQSGLIDHPEVFMFLRVLRLFKLGRIYSLERSVVAKSSKASHGGFSAFDDERIEYVVQKHWVCFVGSLIFCVSIATLAMLALILVIPINVIVGIIVGFVLFLTAMVFFLKLWLDFNYDLIYITNKRVILQERELFGAELNDISYDAITNVKPYNSTIWHWIFKFGDINIETASMQGSLVFKNANHPRRAVNYISENRLKFQTQKNHGASSKKI